MLRRWLALLPLLLVAGCTTRGPVEARIEPSASPAAVDAPYIAPSAPAAAPATATPEPTPTPIAEATAAEVTPTPEPTPAPDQTVDPAAQAVRDDLGYCRRAWGTGSGTSWSGRLENVSAGGSADVAELRFQFADLQGELHGVASCTTESSWPVGGDIGSPSAPAETLLMIDLPDWAHDDRFAASPITQTLTLSEVPGVQGVAFAASSLDSRGAVLGIGLDEPRPFRVSVDGSTLVVEFASSPAFAAADDPLGSPSEAVDARPTPGGPVYFIEGGDVYLFEGGAARNITSSPEAETDVTVSPDGSLLAVCRAPADAERFELPYDVRAALWTMAADGSNAQLLADVGGCAEPRFDADGQRIAFTANVAPSPPARLEVWTVGLDGEPSSSSPGLDEWNRSHPRWLPDGRLIYLADDGSTRILLVRDDSGETELTASLLSGPAYVGVGAFMVDQTSGQVALEALREAGGADLVVLRPDGTRASSERRGFYQRPLDFNDGELVYLSADCPSEAVLSYTVYRRGDDGTIETLVRGTTDAAIGAAALAGNTLIYARHTSTPANLRGPEAIAEDEPGTLWALALDGGERAQLLQADAPIDAVVARR